MNYLPNYYNIFYKKGNEKIIINSNEEYKLIKDMQFIHETDNLLNLSNSNILSESSKNILEEKYNCFICRENIIENKPLMCYQCQRIFHNKCLNKWEDISKPNFSCPICKFKLPLIKWKEKVNYIEERNNEEKRMKDLNSYKKHFENISNIFKRILHKSNEIISLTDNMSKIENKKIMNYKELVEMSDLIFNNFKIIENLLKNKKDNNIKKGKNYGINESKNKLNDVLKTNEIKCKYKPKRGETEIFLMHDYNKDITDLDKDEIKEYLEAREINKQLFNRNIDLYVNDIKTEFHYKLKVNDSKEIKVKIKFKKKLINASFIFYGCSSLESIDLSLLDTSEVINMSNMFSLCSSMKSINLSSFNTNNVTNMGRMFYNCESLESLDLSSFNTINVTNMESMFFFCFSLKSIDLSSFNTSNVTNMSNMFSTCTSLKSIDLSSFDTTKVINMSEMFYKNYALQSIDLSSFKTNKVRNIRNIFFDCYSLKLKNIKIKDQKDRILNQIKLKNQ